MVEALAQGRGDVVGEEPVPQLAVELATATAEGSAALLAARGHDTLGLRRSVTSPGGVTARGLAALEEGGLRAAFAAAAEAAVHGGRR